MNFKSSMKIPIVILFPWKKNMVVMDYSYKLAWTQTVYDDNI